MTSRQWLDEYYDAANAAVQSRLTGATVEDAALVEPSVQKAVACTYCRERVHKHLPIFCKQLANLIDSAIAQVPLDLESISRPR